MMRYQGLSPDNLPLSNGRRSHWRTCKEEEGLIGTTRELDEDSSRIIPNFADGHKGVPRFRSPSSKPPQDHNFSTFSGDPPPQKKNNHHHHNEVNNNNSQVQNGDVLLQWGHRKRSRLSRSIENKAAGSMMTTTTTTTDDSSSSSSPQIQAMINVKRRSVSLPTQTTAPVQETKNAVNTNIMPPPVTITAATNVVTSTSNGKGGNFKSCSKDTSTAFGNSHNIRRNSEERSAGGSGSHPSRNVRAAAATTMVGGGGGAAAAAAGSSSRSSKLGKRFPSKVLEKQHDHKRSITTSTSTTTIATSTTTTTPCSLRGGGGGGGGDDKLNGLMQQSGGGIGISHHQRQQQHNSIASAGSLQEAAGCSTNANTTTSANHHHDDNVNAKNAAATAVAANGEVNEWPRVYIPLTRKEKEEDFLVMKGTKLPHRPKKRPKAVDRMLQYCFPGMWLSDVTKAKYEVKEKKSTTKKPKRRGLKGMESMDSDSE